MGSEDRDLYVSLKEHVAARIDHLEEKLNVISDMNRQAADKAEQQMDKRLAGMNEFRDQLKEQAAKFITRDEIEVRLRALEISRATLEGKASAQALTVTTIMAAISIIIAIIGLIDRLR